MCPYLFSLPPLTLHLPKQLRELEEIVKDLQKLKDNVDQLRKMCADCTVSQTERECGRQSEREHEKRNEGTDRHMDESNWLNEKNIERPKECGTDRVKAEKTMEGELGDGDTESEKITVLEKKGRKKGEAERENDKGVVKENRREETQKEVAERDGKTKTERAKEKDKLGKAKLPMSGGNERIVDMVRKKIVEKNNRETETDRNEDKDGKGNSKGDPEDTLENGKEKTSHEKNKEKTEESDHHVWRHETKETEKKTQTEQNRGSDGIKMSEDHDEHTNKERMQQREERKKEMGTKVERNNEKPKQTESIGHEEKEKTIKEEEVEDREMGTEIKTEAEKTVQSVQRDSDGEIVARKATERTDFVSISPTPHSIISLAPGHNYMESNEAITFTSSLPSPPFSSSTSHLLTYVNRGMPIVADEPPTQSPVLGAAGISENPSSDAEEGFRTKGRPTTTAILNTLGGPRQQISSATSPFTSTTSTGFQGQVSSTTSTTTTTTPHYNLYTTTVPGVVNRNRWAVKKNISSNTKTGVKPLPGRGPKPNEKHKPAIRPETDQKLKNPKNDRKPDQAPLPDKKTKHDQKLSNQKPTTDQKSKPGKDPKQVQIPKPNQRPLSDHLPTDENLKNNKIPKHDQEHTTDPSQVLTEKPKSHQKSMLPVQRPTYHQRPQTVNATGSDKDPQTDQEPESVKIPIITQDLKPKKKPVHPLKTDQTQKPHKKPKSEEKTELDQRSTINQNVPPVQEPERRETTSPRTKPTQKPITELMEGSDENPLPEPISAKDSTPGHELTPESALIKPPDPSQVLIEKPKSHQKSMLPVQRPTYHQRPQTVNTTGSDKDPQTDQEPESVKIPIITQDLKPKKKPVHPLKTDQTQKPHKKPKSEEKTKPDQRSTINQNVPPVQEPERRETTSPRTKPTQKPITELMEGSDESPLPEPISAKDSTPGYELTPESALIKPPDPSQVLIEKPKSHQKSMLPVQRPTYHQRPQTVNTTESDKDPQTDREPESVKIPIITQDLKPKKKPVHPLKTDQTQKLHKKPKSEEKTKPDQRSAINQNVPPVQVPERRETTSPRTKPTQKPITELMEGSDESPLPEPISAKDSTPGHELTPDSALIKPPDQKPKPSQKIPKINQKPNQKPPELITGQKTKPNVKPKPDQTPQINQRLRTPRPDQKPELNLESLPDQIPEAESNKTSKLRPPPRARPPTRPTIRPGATPVQRPKPAVQQKPSPKIKTDLDPLQISETTSDDVQNSQTYMLPAPGPVTQISEVNHSPGDTEFSPSTLKTITLDPKTSNSLETGPFPHRHTLSEGFTMSPNSRIASDLRPQTAGRPPLIPMTTRPNKIIHGILPSVIPSTSPGSTKPYKASNTDSILQTEKLPNMEETAPRQTPDPDKMMIQVPTPSAQTTSTISPDLRSTTPATSGPEPQAAESSTPSARELRVKIKQVAAFFNNSLSPNGRPPDRRPKDHQEDNQGGSRPDSKLASKVRRDCSDHLDRGATKSGVYLVTPDLRSKSFPVFCDMELDGGGWTLLQRRQDGSVSFNRTWAEYRSGFGELDGGEFWLGNNMIHMLTRDRDMKLRTELEDFGGMMAYAEYEHFRVASERMRYRLTVGGYSGTAGDALRFSNSYDHNNRAFTTPDRDNDRYPSGNCGAYYSSGWWFDACMAANLNGRYYVGRYKGVRDGIFWGTWQNISTEYYPTNDRHSFKTVRMMIRPRGFAPKAVTLPGHV
ncbi:titin-like [Cottoperca gobio]|uniref:Titin-like n=1 Tax=Cottoperca gobio TaxID=56716 RepID=A0A6J2PYG8_COTGO|nr:titin-like [Cottoperca gobio]